MAILVESTVLERRWLFTKNSATPSLSTKLERVHSHFSTKELDYSGKIQKDDEPEEANDDDDSEDPDAFGGDSRVRSADELHPVSVRPVFLHEQLRDLALSFVEGQDWVVLYAVAYAHAGGGVCGACSIGRRQRCRR